MDKVKIGDTIKIIKMEGEPQYTNREGVVTHIDDAGQIHGTWGGCAIVPEVDTYIIDRVGRNKSTSHTTVRAVRHTAVQFKIKYVLPLGSSRKD